MVCIVQWWIISLKCTEVVLGKINQPKICVLYRSMETDITTATGVGKEICCAFCVHSAVVNFWNQKPSDAALESSRWEELSYRFCFFIFPFCGFILRKNIFARCFAWCKKTIRVTVFGPVIEKIRENTRALLDDGYNFNFYPKKEKPRFLSSSGCSAEGAPIERFVLASASHWCAGCWGFLHTIFSRLELFLLPR